MTPAVGGPLRQPATVGKLSGRRGLQGKLRELGHDLEGEALDAVYAQVIALADAKKEVTDARPAGARRAADRRPRRARSCARGLERHELARRPGVGHGLARHRRPVAQAEATGNGPVDALYGAIDVAVEAVLGWQPVLAEYEIRAVSAGEDAQGQVVVRVRRSTDEGPEALRGHRPRPLDQHHRGLGGGLPGRRREAPAGRVARAAMLEAARASGQAPEKVEKLP